jgi:hypothetical protein
MGEGKGETEMGKGIKEVVRTGAKGKTRRKTAAEVVGLPVARRAAKSHFCIGWWVNVYLAPDLDCGFHRTRKYADDMASKSRVACIRVLIEGREGDGMKRPRGKK